MLDFSDFDMIEKRDGSAMKADFTLFCYFICSIFTRYGW